MYYLARMPADFLEDPTVQAWINQVVENRSLWKQRLHKMTWTPSAVSDSVPWAFR